MKIMQEQETNNPLYWRDEILQVMYWMQGEGFGTEVSVEDLKKFLSAGDEILEENLGHLKSAGFVESAGGGRFRLTAAGRNEGGRRFADEFEEMMKPGHYECSDPDCDCHDPETAGEPCRHLFRSDALN